MTLNKHFAAVAVAAATALAAAAPIEAHAAPFHSTLQPTVSADGTVTKVGRRARAGAVGAIIGFSIGAAVASGQRRVHVRTCHIKRVKVWSARHGRYFIKRKRVCF